jgi:hypothetical protein
MTIRLISEYCGMPTEHRVHIKRQETVVRKQNLLEELRATRAALERLEDKVAKASRIPDKDPFEEEAVFYFKKRFPYSSKGEYAFAGIKAGGYFYLTGNRHTGAMSWEELSDFLMDGVDSLWLLDAKRDVLVSDTNTTAMTPDV